MAKSKLNPGEFNMQTNMKAKPNSQGTLFRGGGGSRATGRWPRGYSPERQAEVREALPAGFNDRRVGDENRARLTDTIARSTMPVADLNNIRAVRTGVPEAKIRAKGRYDRSSRTLTVAAGREGGKTVIHEIGHHVSAEQGNEFASYDSPVKVGAEEATAENYAEEHYKPKKGAPGAAFTRQPTAWVGAHAPLSATGIRLGWNAVRTTPLNTAQFTEPEHTQGTLF